MNPATALAERLRSNLTEAGRRLDRIEQASNAKELHLPTERVATDDGAGTLRVRPDWAHAGPTDAPEPTPTIEWADLEPLGPAFGRFFLTWTDGREVRVDSEILPAALNDAMGPNRVFVHQKVFVKATVLEVDGVRIPTLDHEEDRHYRATIVPAGTYEVERGRQERAQVVRGPRPVLSARPHDWPSGHELLPWLRRMGIELAMVDGRLLVTAQRGAYDLLRAAIADHAALIVGWLTKRPAGCWRLGCDAEAATTLLGGAPACVEHAESAP